MHADPSCLGASASRSLGTSARLPVSLGCHCSLGGATARLAVPSSPPTLAGAHQVLGSRWRPQQLREGVSPEPGGQPGLRTGCFPGGGSWEGASRGRAGCGRGKASNLALGLAEAGPQTAPRACILMETPPVSPALPEGTMYLWAPASTVSLGGRACSAARVSRPVLSGPALSGASMWPKHATRLGNPSE